MELSFDFGTYNDIKNAINSGNIMRYTIIGGQSVAVCFILIKLIHSFIKDTWTGDNKMNHILENLSLVFLVIVAPYVMDIIDNTFASVEDLVGEFKGGKMPQQLKDVFVALVIDEKSSFFGDMLVNLVSIDLNTFLLQLATLLLGLLGFLVWALDSAVYAIFIIERLIIIEMYRFLFPLMIAFVGIDGLRDRYYKWVISFIGILLLPIPYIAVHTTIDIISTHTLELNKTDEPLIGVLFTIVILIASLGMKYKLLSTISHKMANILS